MSIIRSIMALFKRLSPDHCGFGQFSVLRSLKSVLKCSPSKVPMQENDNNKYKNIIYAARSVYRLQIIIVIIKP